MIKVYFTNHKHDSEGCLDGDFLKLPARAEDITALLAHTHADDIRYETYNPLLSECLGEHESIDELNYLAALINDLHIWEHLHPMKPLIFLAAIQYGKHTGSVKDLINLVQNLSCYYLYEDVMDEEEFGHFYGEELGWLNLTEEEEESFDYEAYGRDICLKLDGEFVDDGFIEYEGGFVEYYRGQDDLPEKYKISACPAA